MTAVISGTGHSYPILFSCHCKIRFVSHRFNCQGTVESYWISFFCSCSILTLFPAASILDIIELVLKFLFSTAVKLCFLSPQLSFFKFLFTRAVRLSYLSLQLSYTVFGRFIRKSGVVHTASYWNPFRGLFGYHGASASRDRRKVPTSSERMSWWTGTARSSWSRGSSSGE